MPLGDFESILNRSMDEVQEPGLYPTGTWLVRNVGGLVRRDDKGREIVILTYVAVEPQDDVDPDELAAAGNSFEGNKLWYRRIIETNDDAFKLKKFIAMHGVEIKGKSYEEGIRELRGREIFAYVGTRTYERQGDMVVENTLMQFAPVK